MRAAFGLIALSLSGCAPDHIFEVTSDKPISAVRIDLANSSTKVVKLSSPYRATAEVDAGDSSGTITVELVGGQHVNCRIGYITNGEAEPHHLIIEDGHCRVPFNGMSVSK